MAPAAVVSAMAKLQSQSTSNPTSIVQKAAVAALKGPQECVEQMRREYIQLRDHVVNGLALDSGRDLHHAGGRVLRLPKISSFLGRGGLKSASDVAGRLLARGARGDGAGRRIRHERAHPRFICDVKG